MSGTFIKKDGPAILLRLAGDERFRLESAAG
jgi:hypothetical protein